MSPHASPLCLAEGQHFKLYEYASLEDRLRLEGFSDDIIGIFKQVSGRSAQDGPGTLHSPIKEPEYARYFQSRAAIQQAPYILSANKRTFLEDSAQRNFLYATLSIAHKNPDHPLNNDYIMQWRVQYDVVNNDPAISKISFCIKTRAKDLQRLELEAHIDHLDTRAALQTILDKYDDAVPSEIANDIDGIVENTSISSISATSRTGYNAVQTRRKYQGISALHKCSHDVQRVVSPALFDQSGRLTDVAERIEFEDEIEGIHFNPLAIPTLQAHPDETVVLDDEVFKAIIEGSLHVHSATIDNYARNQLSSTFNTSKLSREQWRRKKTQLSPIQQSKLSKATFAEAAALGEPLDKSVLRLDDYDQKTMARSEMFALNLQPDMLMSDRRLRSALVELAFRLPVKGSLFPQAGQNALQGFTPNRPDAFTGEQFRDQHVAYRAA